MEPDWTKKISNESICNFFWIFYLVYAFFAVISLLGFASIFIFSSKMPKGVVITQSIYAFITLGIATTMALFHYLICDRALKPGMKQGFANVTEEEEDSVM